MKFSDLVIGFLLVALLIVAIGSFIGGVASENARTTEDFTDDRINFTEFEGFIDTSADTKDVALNSTLKEDLNEEQGNLFFKSIWGSTKQFYSIITGFWRIFTGLLRDILGIPTIVTTTFATILGIVVIFLAWRTLKIGE